MKSLLQIDILQMKNQLKAVIVHTYALESPLIPKVLYVTGMKTELENADIHLDFI
jgi:hypothetical protein